MNATHIKPLFHEKTLKRAMKGFTFPADLDARRQVIRPWIATLHSGTLDIIKEVSLHGDFLKSIFGKILGYTNVIEGVGKAWTLHAETTISHGGGSADGAIGLFSATESVRGAARLKGHIVAPIELKGAGNNLDRPASGRTESAVDQGWGYANYSEGCRWVIVSNYREIRLYRMTKTPAFAERFVLDDLADPAVFARFYFLLCAENFLPGADGQSRIDLLLRESDTAEAAITKDLYSEYKLARFALVEHLRAEGPRGFETSSFVECAQRLLDRVLFVAFCEDRGLLPHGTLQAAHDHKDPYNPTSVWTRLKAVFRWVDAGRDDPPIPGYNGGLFKLDPLLDEKVDIPDALCSQLVRLARFDYDTDVSVDVLGHIFEQSVTDLEELKASTAGVEFDAKKGKRKTQGVYYTPAWVTRHIVKLALGGYLARKAEELRIRCGLDEIPEVHHKKLAKAQRQFWLAYRDEVLKKTRVLDPACGSGAFLVAAFDHLLAEYERVNVALAFMAEGKNVIAGQTGFEDLNKTILTNNLFGVDLSSESVEITKLSLWLKTAERNKRLTFLDDNIQHGNSIIEDATLDPAAFRWRDRFSAVFADGGFDVVIGNPPYVRQELLSPFKPYLQEHFRAYEGTADIYTYFYERGVDVLRPGGVLSFIVTNKWLRSGYGEALRAFFAEHTVFEQIVDFGHSPIFADADVFPCVVSVRKPIERETARMSSVRVCPIPREALGDLNVEQYVTQNGYDVPWTRFGKDSWSLEPPAVDALMEKIRRAGVPLTEYAGVKPYYGVKTGFNDAFVIDTATRDRLIREDSRSAEIIRKFLRGQDIKRWSPEWAGLWMIFARHGIDIDLYPAISRHLEQFRSGLEPRPRDWDVKKRGEWPGRKPGPYKWFEIQDNVAYWQLFDKPKIVWKDLSFHSEFCCDQTGIITNDLCFFLPTYNAWVVTVLNSPLMWSFLCRNVIHGKDDVLRLKNIYMEIVPIAPLAPPPLSEVESYVARLMEFTKLNQNSVTEVLEWLRTDIGIDQPGQALSDFAVLDDRAFAAEVKKRLPKKAGGLSPQQVKRLGEVYRENAIPIQNRRAEADKLEGRLADLVNQAYGLTPEEIDLMWRTAPPRMPGKRPV